MKLITPPKLVPFLGMFCAMILSSQSVRADFWGDWLDNWFNWRAPEPETLLETLEDRREFETLVTAVKAAGLEDALSGDAEFTIFAPTDSAFSRVPEDDLKALLDEPEALGNLLRYHLVSGDVSSGDLESGTVASVNGAELHIEVENWHWYREIKVNQADVVRADITASNGRIHGIDEVLSPDYVKVPSLLELAASNEDFSILAELVEEAGLSRTLSQDYTELTVFAPTNAAFSALPDGTLEALKNDRRALREVLLNHVVYGKVESGDLKPGNVRSLARFQLNVAIEESEPPVITVDGKEITTADVEASNGVLHIVDGVLVPVQVDNLLQVVAANEDLSSFKAALEASGRDSRLDRRYDWPKYTVFAPANEAFAEIAPADLEALLADRSAVREIIDLHLVFGEFNAADLEDGQRLYSLAGERLRVSVGDDGVRINDSLVTVADQEALNGVVHITDSLITLPPVTIADFLSDKSYLSTLNTAVEAAGLTGALAGDGPLTLFAPTDYAFRTLPEGQLDTLLGDTDALTQVLLNHVAEGAVSASDLKELDSIETLQGSDLPVEEKRNRWGWFSFRRLQVGGAAVWVSDIEVDNGLIHLIDRVIEIPAAEEAPDPVDESIE
ncbi:MAG: fasciclin domain-containing protein [Verrucomicrobiota bacterium]